MPDLSHRDFACLMNLLDSIEKINSFSHPFTTADEWYNDQKSFDAVLMNFIVIGEMAEKLSEGFRQITSARIDWANIRGFRNIIAHNYFGVDAEEVWQIIHHYLPGLESEIRKMSGLTSEE